MGVKHRCCSSPADANAQRASELPSDKDPKAALVRVLENASGSRTTGIVSPSNEEVLISERRLEPP